MYKIINNLGKVPFMKSESNSNLAKRFRMARQKRGFSQVKLAKEAKVSQSMISQIESGLSIGSTYLVRIATILNVNPFWLSGELGTDTPLIELDYKDSLNSQLQLSKDGSRIGRVTVRGHVQAGNWQEAIWSEEELYSIPAPILEEYPTEKLYGLIVKGDSMDQEYKEGSFLICVPLVDFKRELKNGDHVVVERQHAGKYEATVKEIEIDRSGRILLWPRSHNPEHQAAFIIKDLQNDNFENDILTRIVGVVLFSLQKRF